MRSALAAIITVRDGILSSRAFVCSSCGAQHTPTALMRLHPAVAWTWTCPCGAFITVRLSP